TSAQQVLSLQDENQTTQTRYTRLQQEHEQEVARLNALGFDVKLVQSTVRYYDSLESGEIKALPFFKGVGEALGRDLRIDKMALTKAGVDSAAARPAASAATGDNLYDASLQLTYPSSTDIKAGNKEVDDLV